ncbi:MAG TPA: AtpZ/AtpI family protein [Gemmataceae bacterium]|jgi:ATP synthase protein I|nr:AtpZ/AtpI family protein [Gemmataceae bacterium]
MDEEDRANAVNHESLFARQVGAQAARKLKAQREATKSIWFGLGMSGLIGWSVTVPTLLGAGLGIWVDKHYPSSLSWTLMLLLLGLIVGCANAWHWVASEYKQIRETKDE